MIEVLLHDQSNCISNQLLAYSYFVVSKRNSVGTAGSELIYVDWTSEQRNEAPLQETKLRKQFNHRGVIH